MNITLKIGVAIGPFGRQVKLIITGAGGSTFFYSWLHKDTAAGLKLRLHLSANRCSTHQGKS